MPHFALSKMTAARLILYGSVVISYQGSQPFAKLANNLWSRTSPPTALAMGTTTFRTGLNATYDLTSRINARAAVYYYNSNNQGSSGTTSAGAQDGLQFTLGLNYRINKHWAVNANYNRTRPSSRQEPQAGYSRNHYFAGVTYHY